MGNFDASSLTAPGTLLARLNGPTAAALLALGVEQPAPAGHVLMREGARESYVVIVRHGVAKVTGGPTVLLSIRVEGDLIGEMSALSGSPRCATVTMAGPGVVRVIANREFAPFLTAHADAAVALAAVACDRLHRSNRRCVDFSAYPVRTRLARVLTELAEVHGRRLGESAVEVGVRLTQPELASLCGVADASIHQALRELRDARVVSTRYGRITVWDLAALRAQAETPSTSRRARREAASESGAAV
ncbi:Crp/Fnr family transcriptional regulator [Actinoplanes sp. LDG1-06]|uniref:Crp/Fnr family transcriptional regulator n=1 Tax=Paractinoplanes ovalisporus TaxID=2810368 RepID=A0ABS2ATW3_9ACTN|nr:Crp/Fnr family transcriptional regulator [Actinoplanes ovalisporus]MBM2623317.1 Crp/Fnr family transcriptional regulator [Actinoplanes ovalisporus]